MKADSALLSAAGLLALFAMAGCSSTESAKADPWRDESGMQGVSIRYVAGGEVEYAPLGPLTLEYDDTEGRHVVTQGDPAEPYRSLFEPEEKPDLDSPASDEARYLLDNAP